MVKIIRKQAAIILAHSVGGVFIVAGIGAGFVPLVPGFVLIIVGLYIISLRSAWLRAKIIWARGRFPKFDRLMTSFELRKAKIFRTKPAEL